jgi:hypothetical protein
MKPRRRTMEAFELNVKVTATDADNLRRVSGLLDLSEEEALRWSLGVGAYVADNIRRGKVMLVRHPDGRTSQATFDVSPTIRRP